MDNEELRRQFTVLTEHLDSKIRLLAEGQSALAETLTRRMDLLDQGMHSEAEETRSLIRLSYSQLDRRVASLEADVSNLRERLERLETRLQ